MAELFGDEPVENQEDVLHPNNNFCFTESDFLEGVTNMNQAFKHHGIRNAAWDKIHKLVGREVECKSNNKDGCIKWKVVPGVFIDDFKCRRENEEVLFRSNFIPLSIDESIKNKNSYTEMFWKLMLSNTDFDIEKLNEIISADNLKRREKFQRPIRLATRSEYIKFHAILIGATVYSQKGEKLWHNQNEGLTNKRIKRTFSQEPNFGEYMKLWRFKELKHYIMQVMEDESVKDDEAWWRFKNMLKNSIKRDKIY